MSTESVFLFPRGEEIVAARLRDLLERLEWVISSRLEELPDTLVAALHKHGIPCDRRSAPQELVGRLRAGQPESRAAAS
jgi:hypothetical protein